MLWLARWPPLVKTLFWGGKEYNLLIAQFKSLNSGMGFLLSFLMTHLFLHAPLVYQCRCWWQEKTTCSKSSNTAPSTLPAPRVLSGKESAYIFPTVESRGWMEPGISSYSDGIGTSIIPDGMDCLLHARNWVRNFTWLHHLKCVILALSYRRGRWASERLNNSPKAWFVCNSVLTPAVPPLRKASRTHPSGLP